MSKDEAEAHWERRGMAVGFIGLGRMGGPMAARVAATGHAPVLAYDIAAARRDLAKAGVSELGSAAEVAAASDILVTSLPGPAEVDDVVYGGGCILKAIHAGTILVETSTIGPAQSRRIAADFEQRHAHYLDAPVSGGIHGARNGTLVAMVGGAPEALARVRPVLSAFAKHVFHLGPVGSGNIMKLVIQSIFLSQMACFLEAVSAGEHSGIPLDTVLDIVAVSAAHHPAVATRYAKLRAKNLEPMFEVNSAVKDLSLADRAWRELFAPLPVLTAALSEYRETAAAGYARSDLIAIRNWINRRDLGAADPFSSGQVVGGPRNREGDR